MTKPRVYVESTIPSFYCEERTAPEIVARRQWTRQWWSMAPSRYELVTSAAVLEELGAGERPERNSERLSLLVGLPLLALESEIFAIVQTYLKHKVMPANPSGDALHLALASYNNCDFLVTWNCQHLANANKFGHIRVINAMLGLFVPAIVTPLELMGDRHASES